MDRRRAGSASLRARGRVAPQVRAAIASSRAIAMPAHRCLRTRRVLKRPRHGGRGPRWAPGFGAWPGPQRARARERPKGAGRARCMPHARSTGRSASGPAGCVGPRASTRPAMGSRTEAGHHAAHPDRPRSSARSMPQGPLMRARPPRHRPGRPSRPAPCRRATRSPGACPWACRCAQYREACCQG
jgi:hypothetical protein